MSACLVHRDAAHFLNNALFFCALSYMIYGQYGLWIHPILTTLLGGLTNLFTLMTYPPYINLVGASGIVYAMAGLWLTLYVLIDRRYSLRSRLLRCAGAVLILLVPETYSPSTSYQAHGIGFLLGMGAGICYFLINRTWLRSFETIEPDVLEDEHELLTH